MKSMSHDLNADTGMTLGRLPMCLFHNESMVHSFLGRAFEDICVFAFLL